MNKKSKNKKGNKLNPGQNEGTKGNENVEITETIESVKSERVPEIVSEILPAEESKVDTPKKPKRNRGKKKKGKDEDSNDIIDETANQDNVEIIKADFIKVIDKNSSGTTINIEESNPEITTAVPAARKKKNKTKTHEKSEDLVLIQEVHTIPLEVSVESTIDAEVSEKSLQSESLEHDINLSNKKTKNKRHNDPEKSDKGELAHSTASFQELLKAKCEPENQTEVKTQDPLTDISHEFKVEAEKINTEGIKSCTSNLFKNTTNEEKTIVEVSKAECKNKKQNKKDKKYAKTEDQSLKLQELKSDVDQTNKKINIKDVKQEIISVKESQEELSSKPAAKIAKPVDMKVKEKFNTITDTGFKDIPKSTEHLEKSIDISNVSKFIGNKEEAVIGVDDILEIPETTKQNKSDDSKKILEFNLPDNIKGKKRKNLPKISKPDAKINDNKEILSTTVVKTEQIDGGEDPLTSLIFPLTSDCTEPIPTQSHTDFTPEPLKKDSTVVAKIEATEKNIEVSNITETTDAITEKESIKKFDKKRNKSPKLPTISKELMMTQQAKQYIKTDIKEQTLEVFDTGKLPTNETGKEKINASSEEPRPKDIEMCSVKTDESESFTPDTMPEASFSFLTSQQFFDDNNNTVIREILPSDNIPVDLPILPTPINIRKLSSDSLTLDKNKIEAVKQSSDIQRHSSKSKDTAIDMKEEKTDVKSKMMEVNQDMEELRLSIEKSLAEFTAIEKSEIEVEKKTEEINVEPREIISITNIRDEDLKSDQIFQKSSDKPIEATGVKTIADDVKISKTVHEPILDNFQFASSTVKLKTIVSQKTDNITENCLFKKDVLDESFQAIDTKQDYIPLTRNVPPIIATPSIHTGDEKKSELEQTETIDFEVNTEEQTDFTNNPTIFPTRRDHKNKHKKKKGKQDSQSVIQESSTTTTTSNTTEPKVTKDAKKEEQAKNKSENKDKGKQQADDDVKTDNDSIEHFEDALTSSVDDVNKIFEMILIEGNEQMNPKINIIPPEEDKTSKVQPSKNLLGHPDIPASSNRRDYKKEKNKTPNESQAKVKIKDCADIEKTSKNTQTTNKIINNVKNYVSDYNGSEDFVYRYSFRKVFLQSSCHVCDKDLNKRIPCEYCNLVFYCSIRHKNEDWLQHQALCFAVSTIAHLKDLKYIYADVQNITGHDYRLVRMQTIVSCEKILKRRLVPWEQEALLYPRLCSTIQCREWRQGKLKDCEGCGQISYCSESPDHLPKTHQRWCKSYSLYMKLVSYQQIKGRLEPKLPSKVMVNVYQISEKINEVLASMYEEKIDMNDIEYAALTQIATAPLTAAYSYQVYRDNGKNPSTCVSKQSCFTVHVVGAELQFEADALNKWEIFFLHLRPDLRELRVVLVNHNLNPSNLPLDLLGKIKLCENCRQNKRRVTFIFQDKRTYSEYRTSDDFVHPDLVCAFNASIQRSSIYNGKDPWPATINTIVKLKTPLLVTAYTITELHKDATRIKECSELPYTVISEPKYNTFASVRPDRNFISDDEMPLIFKNYCYIILCG